MKTTFAASLFFSPRNLVACNWLHHFHMILVNNWPAQLSISHPADGPHSRLIDFLPSKRGLTHLSDGPVSKRFRASVLTSHGRYQVNFYMRSILRCSIVVRKLLNR